MLVGPPILPGPPFGLLSIWVVPAKKDRAPGPAPGLKRPPLPSGLARNQRDRRVPRSVDARRFLFARIFSLQALVQLHAGEIATLLVDILRAQLLPTVFPGCTRHLGAGAPSLSIQADIGFRQPLVAGWRRAGARRGCLDRRRGILGIGRHRQNSKRRGKQGFRDP